MKRVMILTVFLLTLMLSGLAAGPADAFNKGTGCGGDCRECHTLTKDEASKLLKTEMMQAEVTNIKDGPIKGVWAVELTIKNQNMIAYIDYAKKYLIEGRFTSLDEIGKAPKLRKIDISTIPLDDALIMGDKNAPIKIIVFDDPDCPYCGQMHEHFKNILKTRKDIAFYLKLYPLPIHPAAYDKSKTIICEKSVKLLEDAYANKPIPAPTCETDAVDKNIALAASLGISGTPTIILPDGRVIPGMVDGKALLMLLEDPDK
ncbi:MAG: DsbC family protein [Thermodesulfobacteriota bacterium]